MTVEPCLFHITLHGKMEFINIFNPCNVVVNGEHPWQIPDKLGFLFVLPLLKVLVELVVVFVAASHDLELVMDALPKGRKNIDKVVVRTDESVLKVFQNQES